jgi:acyl carrier protein phosphodiesterase
MNFLAHIYLSGSNNEIKVGNFVADWIKGSDFRKYAPDIQIGIIMHRSIDSFTDNHPIIKTSKNRLAEAYGKYAGIIVDILYDHILAKEWHLFSNIPLDEYSNELYAVLSKYIEVFPEEIRDFIPRFMRRRWLESYATPEGIGNVLNGMSKHTSLPNHTDQALQVLQLHFEDFRREFFEYFPQLIAYVEDKYQITVRPN